MLHSLEYFDEAIALLVERCVPGAALSSRPEAEQDVVIASLLRQLWIEPAVGHRFRPLQEMYVQWADEFEDKLAHGRMGVDLGLAREGIALFQLLPTTAERNVLLCTDLHAGNVLAAKRCLGLLRTTGHACYVGDLHGHCVGPGWPVVLEMEARRGCCRLCTSSDAVRGPDPLREVLAGAGVVPLT